MIEIGSENFEFLLIPANEEEEFFLLEQKSQFWLIPDAK